MRICANHSPMVPFNMVHNWSLCLIGRYRSAFAKFTDLRASLSFVLNVESGRRPPELLSFHVHIELEPGIGKCG